jgi:CubicO group peptidase (beta-lactamase class C family)
MKTMYKTVLVAIGLTGLAACNSSAAIDSSTEAVSDSKALEALISTRLVDNRFSGVVLAGTDGTVVHRAAYSDPDLRDDGPLTPDAGFALASLTKPFTAVLVLQLMEEGLLSLDDTIASHLPDYGADYSDRVTIRQLLQNRSGIPHTVDIPGWFDASFKESQTPEIFIETIASLPLRFEPDADYLYSNLGYYLLGMIVEHVTGRPFAEALSERVLEPLGMVNTGQIYADGALEALAKNYLREDDGTLVPVPLTNPRLFLAAASLYSTADDLMRWGQAVMGTDLISVQSKAIMLDPATPMGWVVGEQPFDDGSTSTIYTYNGELAGYTSMLILLPEHGHTIIVLNNNNAGYEALAALSLDIAAELITQKTR